MEFNTSYIRTNSGVLISALTGRRYSEGQEAQLFKDNERHTAAANLRAQAVGERNPTPNQIRSGEFGDNRSVTMRVADDVAAKNPRSEINPYSAAIQLNLAKQANANFTDRGLEADAGRLKVKEAEYESRREKLASIPQTEAAAVDDVHRAFAEELRNAPKQPGEGNWRKLAADALDRKADQRDAEQRAADAEQVRQNDPFFKNTILNATAQLRFLELRGDVEQAWVNEARQTLADVQSGACPPEVYWQIHEPISVERMGQVNDRHRAERDRRQAEVDAYEQAAKEGKEIAPPPAAATEVKP